MQAGNGGSIPPSLPPSLSLQANREAAGLAFTEGPHLCLGSQNGLLLHAPLSLLAQEGEASASRFSPHSHSSFSVCRAV